MFLCWKKILKWGASLIVLLVLIGSCAGDNSTKSTSSSATTKATQDAPKVKTYSAGQYKIGKYLPAGEYVVISNGDSYIELASDSTGNFSSIIANDVFKNRSVITVQDGQYLKVQRGTIYAAKDAPKVELKNGMLPSCMYKVGIDFPAGEYKVTSNGGDSYIEVSRDSSHNMSSIISNDLFTGDRYIQVSDGQYLKFFNCEVKIK